VPTLQESFEELKSRVKPKQAAGLDVLVQFEISGDPGGTWHVVIKDGNFHLSEGSASAPNLTLQISSQDWFDMVAGRKSSHMLFLTGRLKVKGDTLLSMRLASLLNI
jgi:putative sterol carrier protein